MQQRQNAVKVDEVSQRVNYVVCENTKGIEDQLRQYGFSQIDGFLGGSIHGYPDKLRDEMYTMFNRGWFEQQSESEASFKVGPYRVTNQDRENRFRSKLLGSAPGDENERKVEAQYELAPTVVSFTRSLVVSLAQALAKVAGSTLSSNVATAEMVALCGQGARYDRRVSNEYGWNTKQGFVPDPRKITAVYFVNPRHREELGGHLQLEGVISPTGAVSISPVHDRLVLFWADKTVWSVRPSQASMISEHQYCIMMHLMAEDHSAVKYDPTAFARWFPELRGRPMDWTPPRQIAPAV